MKNIRMVRKDVNQVWTRNRIYEIDTNQYFCETGKAWEMWDENGLLRMIKRIDKKYIQWIFVL
jgi:hypothetical protein